MALDEYVTGYRLESKTSKARASRARWATAPRRTARAWGGGRRGAPDLQPLRGRGWLSHDRADTQQRADSRPTPSAARPARRLGTVQHSRSSPPRTLPRRHRLESHEEARSLRAHAPAGERPERLDPSRSVGPSCRVG